MIIFLIIFFLSWERILQFIWSENIFGYLWIRNFWKKFDCFLVSENFYLNSIFNCHFMNCREILEFLEEPLSKCKLWLSNSLFLLVPISWLICHYLEYNIYYLYYYYQFMTVLIFIISGDYLLMLLINFIRFREILSVIWIF